MTQVLEGIIKQKVKDGKGSKGGSREQPAHQVGLPHPYRQRIWGSWCLNQTFQIPRPWCLLPADWASLILQVFLAFPWDKALVKQVVCPFNQCLIETGDPQKVQKRLLSNVECDTTLSVYLLWTDWDQDENTSIKTDIPTAGSTNLCLFSPLSYNKARVLFFHSRK